MFLLLQEAGLRKALSPLTTPTKTLFQSPILHSQGGNSYPDFSLTRTTSDQEWELLPGQIAVEDKLGHGAFGDVYMGTLRGRTGSNKTNGVHSMTVAIKLLKCKFKT